MEGMRANDLNAASRKAHEADFRRFQATEWLESIVGQLGIPKQPSEEQFISCLRNGLVLCHAINKIEPGSVPKVVEISRSSSKWDSKPLPAYQFFENDKNFFKAVEGLKLPVFEASVLERDNMVAGSSAKIVDCVLGLKEYNDRKPEKTLEEQLQFRFPLSNHNSKDLTTVESGSVTSSATSLSPNSATTGNTKYCLAADCNHQQVVQVQEEKLRNLKDLLSSIRAETGYLQSQFHNDLKQMESRIEELCTAAQGYHKVVEENKSLYNMIQDLKGIVNSDRLGILPIDLRIKILSFLPIKSAVLTSSLSKDWTESWELLTSIHLDETEFANLNHLSFSLFVDNLLKCLKGQCLEVFRLHLWLSSIERSRCWIQYAISHNITELDLQLSKLDLPSSVFTCKALVKLRLRMDRFVMDHLDQMDFAVCLPKLQTLDTSAHHLAAPIVIRIVRGAPILTNLTFSNCCFLPGVAPMPMSLNVKTLNFVDTVHGLATVLHVLDNCPSLKNLSIGKLLEDVSPIRIPPSCIKHSLIALEVSYCGYSELDLIRYFLSNAEQLKKLQIRRRVYLAPHMRRKISEVLKSWEMLYKRCQITMIPM